MLDYRIHTFMKLCELMNYRATAEALNMTQPAVTQHIHYLEKEYHCKLFLYDGKQLSKTSEAKALEIYLRSICYNDENFRQSLKTAPIKKISVGATKTIGDYMIAEKIQKILMRNDIELTFYIDNTAKLLDMLNAMELDLALIEGYFDKKMYQSSIIRVEKLVGICPKGHPFAGKNVSIEDLFKEKIIIREEGSGTRAVFEHFLTEHNYSLDCFQRKAIIGSFKIIKESVMAQCGISFVYESVAVSEKNLGIFTIQDAEITHELNFVSLKNANTEEVFSLFQGNST